MANPHEITLTDWVERQAPELDVITASEPQPVLQEYNLIAVSDTVEAARAVVVEWERIEPHDGAVGFVALGASQAGSADTATIDGADPRQVVRHTARQANRGVLPGALVGAALVTLMTAVVTGWTPVLVGAAVGGAAIGAVAGAFLTFTRGTSWGSAYQDSFVEPGATDLAVASIHSDQQRVIDDAVEAADDLRGVRLYGIGPAGNTVDLAAR